MKFYTHFTVLWENLVTSGCLKRLPWRIIYVACFPVDVCDDQNFYIILVNINCRVSSKEKTVSLKDFNYH